MLSYGGVIGTALSVVHHQTRKRAVEKIRLAISDGSSARDKLNLKVEIILSTTSRVLLIITGGIINTIMTFNVKPFSGSERIFIYI